MASPQNEAYSGVRYQPLNASSGTGVNNGATNMPTPTQPPPQSMMMMKMSKRSSGAGGCFLIAAIVVLVGEYFGYIGVLLKPYLWPTPTREGLIAVAAFHVVFLLCLLAFLQSALTDPGKVPVHWGFYIGEESKRRRYCKVCNVWKPDRTHHCSACGRCVLNMDHHCPWIGNCVGFYNRKFFIQLLFYATICLGVVDVHGLYFLFSKGVFMLPNLDSETLAQHATDLVSYTVVCIMLFVSLTLTFALIPFLRFHVALIMRNSTTIENMDLSLRDNGRFDLGTNRNLEQVLGRNVLLWWLPCHLPASYPDGNGVHWRKHYLRAIEEDEERGAGY